MANLILYTLEELHTLITREEYRPALFKSNEERETLLERYWIPVRSKSKLLDAYMPTRCADCRKWIWITAIDNVTYYRHGGDETILKLDASSIDWKQKYLSWISLQHSRSN